MMNFGLFNITARRSIFAQILCAHALALAVDEHHAFLGPICFRSVSLLALDTHSIPDD